MNNSKQLTFGLLSTIDNPLLTFFINSIVAEGLINIVVLLDLKPTTKKDKGIWEERTGGYFEKVDVGKESILGGAPLQIPFYFVRNHNDDSTLEIITTQGIDCLFNAGTPRKISQNVIQSVKYGVINVHPGLLPQYRGSSAVEWAIFNDEKIGNTAHFMDEGYDSGPIITSEWYEFPADASYQAIRVRVYRDGCVLAGKVLRTINDFKMTPNDGLIQDENEARYLDPIPDDKFAEVLNKIENERYAYQTL